MSVPMPRRLVIVVRADPVICGHSGEARNLAEAAMSRGFTDVRILTWPLERLIESGLPLKPADGVLPYSPGIVVERPAPVGDERVPDGRYLAGLTGRLVELFTDGVPTVCLSLYLSPHTLAVAEALWVARGTGLPVRVVTIAEAVGSDVTHVIRSCVEQGRFGAGAQVLESFLDSDCCVAVSAFTKELIVSAASELDVRYGTRYAQRCREQVHISYPAIDTSSYLNLDPDEISQRLRSRGLSPGGYVLFLSRLAAAKGVDDLIDAYSLGQAKDSVRLVIAGRGPQAEALRARAAASPVRNRIVFLDDVDDDEKPFLMGGSAAYLLPSKPRPEFVETFGIASVEAMLAGGGPVITTATGGIAEAVGAYAVTIPAEDVHALSAALDDVVLEWDQSRTGRFVSAAREHAMQFDRSVVFDRLISRVDASGPALAAS